MIGAVTNLTTTHDVVDALGGLQATATIAGAKYSAVANWRLTGRFPARTYLILQNELIRRGLNAPPSLWGMTLHNLALKPRRRRRRNGTPAVASAATANRLSGRD